MNNCTSFFRTLVLCVCFLSGIYPTFSQQIEKSLVSSSGERIGFLEYKPAEYLSEGNVKHPVIIFLHGIGERGNGTTELKNVARIGLPSMIRNGAKMKFTWNGKTETFLVVSPQCPSHYGMWPQQMVNDFVHYVKTELHSDTNRIYLTGLSMGGGGSFRFISTSPVFPTTVSAVATVCAPCTFSEGSYVAKAKLPLWSFHASDDPTALASCTDRAINRINAANPEVKPIRTIWPTGGHAVWDRVYLDTNYKYDGVINIYEWFLGQNKSFPVNSLPVANAGKNFTIRRTLGDVTLDGSASTDDDGKIVRYVWRKIAGPNGVLIANRMSASSSTTVSGLSALGNYQFELAVVDERAGFSRDTVTVTVSAADSSVAAPVPQPLPPTNHPPVARVQPDQVIPIEWNYDPGVSASPSTDADGYIKRCTWEKISGPDKYVIASPNTIYTRLRGLEVGEYVFRATVYDNNNASSYADVRVTVTGAVASAMASSSSIEVPLTVLKAADGLKAFPNPTLGMVNVEFSSETSGNSLLNVYDLSGRLLRSVSFYKPAGVYRHNIDFGQLTRGVYYIQIQTNNAVQVQTRIVKR